MQKEEMLELFEKHNDKYVQFEEHVKNPLSKRPDLHVFLLIDKLVPGNTDIISAAEHDVFYIDVDPEELAKDITEEQIIELVACGVSYTSAYDCFYMFT